MKIKKIFNLLKEIIFLILISVVVFVVVYLVLAIEKLYILCRKIVHRVGVFGVSY